MTANLAIAQLLLSIFLVGVTLIWGIFKYRRGSYHRRGRYSRLQAYLLWILSGLIGLSAFFPLAFLYTDHLWYENLGYAGVFWNLHKIRWGFFGLCFIVAVGFMNVNAAVANMLCPESSEFRRWTHTRTFSFHRTVVCITVVLGLLFATPMLLLDDIVVRYLNQPGSVAEAVASEAVLEPGEEEMPTSGVEEGLHFGRDRNFYLFSYPMHKWVSRWVEVLLWVTCVVIGILYNFYYRRDAHTMARVKRHIIFHGTVLWLLLLLVSGWRSYVELWGKVYTKPLTDALRTFHGLFYVDAHLEGATKIYCGLLLGIAIGVVLNTFWRRRVLWYLAAAVWGVGYVLLIHAYPLGLHVARMRVKIFEKEGAYLQRHIEETRLAFELDTIQTVKIDKGIKLATPDMIEDNQAVKENIQLWDRRVLYEALRDSQIVRHYDFHPYTDVDRYEVGPEYRQVLIAAREVDPADTVTDWDRLKLDYTYGYGVCVAPVNEFADEGAPHLWVKGTGTPLESKHAELRVSRPEIYYGEMTHDYVVVKTLRHRPGLDEAAGESEVPVWQRHEYTGTGGVALGGWFRRFCFALRFDFFRLLSPENLLTPESRIMFRRKIGTRRGDRLISDRVAYIAPFLNYDPDPYIVINNKELYWIIDFYVTSRYYPNSQMYVDDTAQLTVRHDLYEEPDFEHFNYIRNSGVAVVNAYTGAVNFYAIKEDEEVIQSYRRAFPGLFQSLSDMPAGLVAHLRYPDYLTRIQAKLYGHYHQEARSFFGTNDTWSIPKEAYYSSVADQEMMPYYAMLKLPGGTNPEFVNMIPFTPPEKEKKLKAWMVVRCDQPHYGERIVYVLPEGAGIPGPTQVEEGINKVISDRLLEWKAANEVIRGNLLIIPIDGTLFYVEPIYLQAKKAQNKKGEGDDKPRRPTLEMVVVKAGSSDIGTAKTLDDALDVIFLGGTADAEPAAEDEKTLTTKEILKQSRQTMDQLFNQLAELIEAADK